METKSIIKIIATLTGVFVLYRVFGSAKPKEASGIKENSLKPVGGGGGGFGGGGGLFSPAIALPVPTSPTEVNINTNTGTQTSSGIMTESGFQGTPPSTAGITTTTNTNLTAGGVVPQNPTIAPSPSTGGASAPTTGGTVSSPTVSSGTTTGGTVSSPIITSGIGVASSGGFSVGGITPALGGTSTPSIQPNPAVLAADGKTTSDNLVQIGEKVNYLG
jgi:hypothetical protein